MIYKCIRIDLSYPKFAHRLYSTMAPPIVKLPNLGSLEGCTTETAWSKAKVYQFLGIKYAESPTGERRFKPPVPIQPWSGIRKADKYGAQFPVIKTIAKLTPDKLTPDLEDCLTLNVFSRDLSGKKPVLVYVHGGGFVDGGAYRYPPQYLLEKDIVLVVPQYRIGPLGFLSTLTDGIPGNAGFLDCVLALKWIQQNIEHFGGDPKRVTVAGQSAGSSIVSAMTFSPVVPDNLFNQVILQSGSCFASWNFDVNPLKHAKAIGRFAGLNPKMSIDEMNDAFIKMDIKTLLMAFVQYFMSHTINGVHDIGGHRMAVGGPTNVFPKPPYDLHRAGLFRKDLKMLAGAIKNDGAFALANAYDIISQSYDLKNDPTMCGVRIIKECEKLMGIEEYTGTLSAYNQRQLFTQDELKSGDFRVMGNGLMDVASNIIVKAPTLKAAQNNALYQPNDTYLYAFNYEGSNQRFGYGEDIEHYPFHGGVSHEDENIYMYPYPKCVANLNEEDTKIAKKTVDLWTSFVINGKPSAEGIEWPPLTNVTGPYLEINKECKVKPDFLDEFDVATREKKIAKSIDEIMPADKKYTLTAFERVFKAVRQKMEAAKKPKASL